MPFYYVKNRIAEIAKIINGLGVKEVLDFGGGNKSQGDLKKLITPEINYKSVDLKKADIIKDLNKEFRFNTECIVAGEVIEHLIDPRKFLKSCYHSLKPKGYLITTTQNFGFWRFRVQALTGRVPDCIRWTKFEPSQHMHIFDWPTFEQIVRGEGFKILKRVKLTKFWLPWSLQPNIFLVCQKYRVKK